MLAAHLTTTCRSDKRKKVPKNISSQWLRLYTFLLYIFIHPLLFPPLSQVPAIQVEAASEAGSSSSEDDEAAVGPQQLLEKPDSCDSGHEEDSCSEPDSSSQDFEPSGLPNERTR